MQHTSLHEGPEGIPWDIFIGRRMAALDDPHLLVGRTLAKEIAATGERLSPEAEAAIRARCRDFAAEAERRQPAAHCVESFLFLLQNYEEEEEDYEI
jgi:hypothetical protein